MATTRYLEITAAQEPFYTGEDDNGRHVYIFNVNTWKHPSATLTEEIAALLVNATVGTWKTDIFNIGATLPDGDGPYLVINEQGGAPPLRTQNEVKPPASRRPSAQIIVHGKSNVAARTMIHNAFAALDGVRNTDVTPITP